jgi:hypothetical protein
MAVTNDADLAFAQVYFCFSLGNGEDRARDDFTAFEPAKVWRAEHYSGFRQSKSSVWVNVDNRLSIDRSSWRRFGCLFGYRCLFGWRRFGCLFGYRCLFGWRRFGCLFGYRCLFGWCRFGCLFGYRCLFGNSFSWWSGGLRLRGLVLCSGLIGWLLGIG